MNSVNHVFEARHILTDSYMILSGSCLIIIIVRVYGNCIASFAIALIGFIMCSDGFAVFYFSFLFFFLLFEDVSFSRRHAEGIFFFENQPAHALKPRSSLHFVFFVLSVCLVYW